jgi:hypothetical protein
MAMNINQITRLINETAGFSITHAPKDFVYFNGWDKLIESSKGNIKIQSNDSGQRDLGTLTMELFWYEYDLLDSRGNKLGDKIHWHYYSGFPKQWETII